MSENKNDHQEPKPQDHEKDSTREVDVPMSDAEKVRRAIETHKDLLDDLADR